MKKKLFFLYIARILFLMAGLTVYASTLEDGAYTVGRQTSYVNPETGSTVDGGTNIALGDSMCASIVEDHLLVEQTNGKIYVTIGIGLMSNIENVRIQVQDMNGTYHDAAITMTGSCQRDGDTCNHYRFEVFSADRYISPIIYVAPMGRDVQFFVKLDLSTAQAGTGSFVSEMVQKASDNTTPPEQEQPTEAKEEPVVSEAIEQETSRTEVSQAETSRIEISQIESSGIEDSAENRETDIETETIEHSQTEKKEVSDDGNGNIIWGIIGVVIVLAAVGVWYFCFFKKKRV